MNADRPKFAGDLMTRDVVTLRRDESIDHLEEAMRMLRFRHLPVVEEGRLIGVVTQRDLLRATPAGPIVASAIMSRDIATVREATPLTEVARVMLDRKIGCVPVVDEGGVLRGLITEADFVKLALRLLEG